MEVRDSVRFLGQLWQQSQSGGHFLPATFVLLPGTGPGVVLITLSYHSLFPRTLNRRQCVWRNCEVRLGQAEKAGLRGKGLHRDEEGGRESGASLFLALLGPETHLYQLQETPMYLSHTIPFPAQGSSSSLVTCNQRVRGNRVMKIGATCCRRDFLSWPEVSPSLILCSPHNLPPQDVVS